MLNYSLICCIVNNGRGSKVLKTVRRHGGTGGTVCLGRGTVKNRFLEFLDINDTHKEIVFIPSEKNEASNIMKALDDEMELRKPNHGIVFSFSLCGFGRECIDGVDKKIGENKKMYKAIFTIVDRGKAEDVMEVATKAGARGGTIINARGTTKEINMLFSMAIEPEKEIVLILSENSLGDSIMESIAKMLDIEKPGHGIMFALDVNEALGLF